MKAEIKADGTLFIKAETELESYAIRRWIDDNWKPTCSKTITTENIEFDWGLTKKTENKTNYPYTVNQ